ncbi:hypothetical protein K438DRAFT_1786480 [Mycena galopus ATCC 62051]|nr:hypothetical protein K438DRAFT_1786480 [Mycena galopus ATCC 62051]
MCSLVCQDMGCHAHLVYCRAPDSAACSGAEIQHIETPITPNPTREKDWISHSLFWRRTGFKDPYSRPDQVKFSKCDAMCPDPEHAGTATNPPHPSYCTLPIFHPPAKTTTGLGYLSRDGHVFNCESPLLIRLQLDRMRKRRMRLFSAQVQNMAITPSQTRFNQKLQKPHPKSLRRKKPHAAFAHPVYCQWNCTTGISRDFFTHLEPPLYPGFFPHQPELSAPTVWNSASVFSWLPVSTQRPNGPAMQWDDPVSSFQPPQARPPSTGSSKGDIFGDSYAIDLLMADIGFSSVLRSNIPEDDDWSSWWSSGSRPVSAAPSSIYGDPVNRPVIFSQFLADFDLADEAADMDALLGWKFKPSNVTWLDPDVTSEVAEFPQGIKLTGTIETISCFPNDFASFTPISHTVTKYEFCAMVSCQSIAAEYFSSPSVQSLCIGTHLRFKEVYSRVIKSAHLGV